MYKVSVARSLAHRPVVLWQREQPVPTSWPSGIISAGLFCDVRWRRRKCRADIAVRVVHLEVLAQELLLTRLVRQMPSYEITVLLGLENGDQVDARPHLLASKLTVSTVS